MTYFTGAFGLSATPDIDLGESLSVPKKKTKKRKASKQVNAQPVSKKSKPVSKATKPAKPVTIEKPLPKPCPIENGITFVSDLNVIMINGKIAR